MNRHHPYGGYDNHRGGSQGGPGPDRSHRGGGGGGGGNRGRGYGRGRGGAGGGSGYNSGSAGGYDTSMSYSAYDQTPDASYGAYGDQQTTPSTYFNTNAYGSSSSSQYGGYNQGYAKFEDGLAPDEDNFGRAKKQGRKDRDDKVHDSIIEERIQRERPCRTLFIRNIKYETNSGDVRRQFEEHGDIKTFFDLISTRGMVFVTYFDLRAAERARDRLQGSEISGRPIDVHYSLPRDDRDNDKNSLQGCLQVTLKNSASGMPIDDNEVRRKFQQFGDVKSVQPVGDRIDSRYIEYYDTRACDEAHDRLRHQGLQDGVMDIVFAWDPNEGGAQGSQSRRGGNRGGGGGGGSGEGYNDWDDGGSKRGRSNRGGRGRGRGRDSYDDDYDRGGGGGGNYGRDREVRGGGRGGRYEDDYSGGGRRNPPGSNNGYNDRYESRGGGYGSGPDYAVPTFSQPPPAAPPVTMPSMPPASADDRLEQARKVQQLLAALKQPAGAPTPPNVPSAGMPNMHMHMQPPPGGQGFYPPPPSALGQGPFPGMMPTYGVPPPQGPPAATSAPPPPAGAGATPAASLSNLPPNILALLQNAQQHGSPGMPPPPGMQGAPFTMPPMMGSSPPNGPSAGGNYQQLMSSYLHPPKRP